MGYRSDVAICLKKEDYEELARRAEELEDNIIAIADLVYFDEKNEVAIIRWGCIKWYNGYPEVDLVEKFLNELDEQGKPFHYINIGEELTDIEERCGTWEDGICCRIHICRDIELDI